MKSTLQARMLFNLLFLKVQLYTHTRSTGSERESEIALNTYKLCVLKKKNI
jgi:hypothetical protein